MRKIFLSIAFGAGMAGLAIGQVQSPTDKSRQGQVGMQETTQEMPIREEIVMDNNVPEEIKSKFQRAYPNVTDAEWTRIEDQFAVTFTDRGNKKTYLRYVVEDAKVEEKSTEVSQTEIPSKIATTVSTDYPEYQVDSYWKRTANNKTFYKVKLRADHMKGEKGTGVGMGRTEDTEQGMGEDQGPIRTDTSGIIQDEQEPHMRDTADVRTEGEGGVGYGGEVGTEPGMSPNIRSVIFLYFDAQGNPASKADLKTLKGSKKSMDKDKGMQRDMDKQNKK